MSLSQVKFPSPFGVEGISTNFIINLEDKEKYSFRLRLEWKVFQQKALYRNDTKDILFPSPFGVEGISTNFK